MREILFRGKCIDNGEWVNGWYCEACYGAWPLRPSIIPMEEARGGYYRPVEIDTATVGQYTGMTDKNGKKIWESDILFDNHPSVQKAYSVIWFDGSFVRRTVDGHYLSFNVLYADEFEVIGNTIDNPELLQN